MNESQASWPDSEIESALQRLESALRASGPDQTHVTPGHAPTLRDLELLVGLARETHARGDQPWPDRDAFRAELSSKFSTRLTAADTFSEEQLADILGVFDYVLATAPDLIVMRDHLMQHALQQRERLTRERWFIYERLLKLAPEGEMTPGRTIWQLFEAVEGRVARAEAV
jgi:hypothetical protein